MRKIIKSLLSYFLAFLIIGLILFLLRDHWADLGKVTNLSLAIILIVGGIFVINQCIQAFILQRLLATSGCRITLKKSFYLVSVRSFLNYLPLNAGMFSNGVYLKRVVNFPVSQFLGLFSGAVLLSFLSYSFIGLIYILYLVMLGKSISLVLTSIIIIMFTMPIILISIRIPFLKKENRLINLINRFHKGWELLRRKKADVAIIIICQILGLFLFSLRFYLIARDLDINMGFEVIIFINIFGSLLRLNTLFPGNLGLREAVAGAVAASFSVNFVDGFLPTATDHLLAMFVIFAFGIPFLFKLNKDMRNVPVISSQIQYTEYTE
ncbi:MAG: lysylphosphatidylglycerol synthase domain-containing protein [Calditrichota bacterium]